MTMTMTKTMLMSVARRRNPCGRASGRGGKARRGGLGAGRQAGCGRLPEAQPAARRGGGSSVEEEELLDCRKMPQLSEAQLSEAQLSEAQLSESAAL